MLRSASTVRTKNQKNSNVRTPPLAKNGAGGDHEKSSACSFGGTLAIARLRWKPGVFDEDVGLKEPVKLLA
jgi:hypothetical protein